MFRSTPHLVPQTIEARPPLSRYACLVILYGVALAFCATYTLGTSAVSMAVFAMIVMITGVGLVHRYPHRNLGACNAVTLGRATLVAFLAGALIAVDVSPWIVFGIATLAFALDGVDGWLARQSGLVSDFGARFDMETDSALAAVMSLWLLISGSTGPEILVLGFMRYGFVFASFFLPALSAPLPASLRRKVICVIQIAALAVLIFPLTPTPLAAPVTIAAAALLSWSFLTDILWLMQRRPR